MVHLFVPLYFYTLINLTPAMCKHSGSLLPIIALQNFNWLKSNLLTLVDAS